MYMLSLNVLVEKLGMTPEEFRDAKEVTVPAALLKFLLQAAVVQSTFDEKGYLAANPDVADAVRRGRIKDVRRHYVTSGYLENRQGGHPAVDEEWYLKTYPDVAKAVRAKKAESGTAHFATTGAGEFRAPAAEYVRDAVEWAGFFGKDT